MGPAKKLTPRRHIALAFLYAVPIAVLGGLIGLGGAEFRLPVLSGPLGHPVRRAVPLNLSVSLVTLAVAFAARGRTLSVICTYSVQHWCARCRV